MGCGKKKGGKKKIALMLLMAVVLCGTAYADQTNGTDWNTPSDPLNSFLNANAQHNHGYNAPDELKTPLGLGIDAKVWEFDSCVQAWGIDSVNVEYKWDMNNQGHSVYGVTHVNLHQLAKKLIG